MVLRKRRKEYELHELIAMCEAPDALEERVEKLKEIGNEYPEFRNFLILCVKHKDEFSGLLAHGPLTYTPSKMEKGGSNESISSIMKEVISCYNSTYGSNRIKRGKAQRLLAETYRVDAELLYQMFTGTFKNDRLNETVISMAFPDFFPN